MLKDCKVHKVLTRFCLSSAHLRRSVWNSLGGRACRVSMGWCAPGRECSEHVKKIPPQAAFAVSPSFFICLHLSFFLYLHRLYFMDFFLGEPMVDAFIEV